jgi:hypothetical protein
MQSPLQELLETLTFAAECGSLISPPCWKTGGFCTGKLAEPYTPALQVGGGSDVRVPTVQHVRGCCHCASVWLLQAATCLPQSCALCRGQRLPLSQTFLDADPVNRSHNCCSYVLVMACRPSRRRYWSARTTAAWRSTPSPSATRYAMLCHTHQSPARWQPDSCQLYARLQSKADWFQRWLILLRSQSSGFCNLLINAPQGRYMAVDFAADLQQELDYFAGPLGMGVDGFYIDCTRTSAEWSLARCVATYFKTITV